MMDGAEVGAYRVLRRIGEGGMGAVWLAEHAMLGRRAAIKVLHPEFSSCSESVTRFFNEARAATTIGDPGVVQIFDFGHHSAGSAYIVMELLDGEPLDRRLARHGALGLSDALRIMHQVASTLGAAHARGIVHRTLKPENVFIVRDPEVASGERAKILDFGIAKLVGNHGGVKTQTATVMGTPLYMSPEQCRGAGLVDQRSDVYALGCVLFTLMVGRPPFDAEGVGDIIAMHLREVPPAPSSLRPGIPLEVDRLVLRCLAKDPAERFGHAGEFALAIGSLLASTSQFLHMTSNLAFGIPSNMGQASIAARFLEQARYAARAPALLWQGETISYGELLKRTQDAAARLAGAPPGPVGVLATKSPESVALILGCLLTGRAFLVASASLPEATLAELVERAGCVRVFTDPPGGPAAGLAETTPQRAAIPAARTAVETAAGSPVELALGGPRDIGFMLTTSGSTGTPKIVPLPNGAVAEFARWADTTFGLGPQQRVLNYAPLNFDLCLLDIWATLAAGGCCALVDHAQATNGPALAHQITEAALHVVQAVPLLFELLMNTDLVAPSVRHVIVTGYAIRAECLATLPRMFPNARLHNLYGCTETNDSFLAPLRPGAPLVLGDPLPGVTALLVSADGREVIGEGTGELWVATAFQTPGYLGGALAEKFVERDGVRFFRSGDLVQRHGDGSLTLLGRTDFQVKVAGQRVNLQEVEQCLLAHPSVLEAAVAAIADERYGHRLHASVSRRPGAILDSLQLRRHCVAHLPRAAMPQTIAIADQALPKTSTGKVDRNRIKELAWTAGTPSSSTS